MATSTTPTAAAAAAEPKTRTATVTLFKPSGKYYTSESWRVPAGATGPHAMCASPDFRQINGGAVLVETDAGAEFPNDENFGVPHIIFVPTNAEVRL
jgi:hypothetical protein